MCDAQQSPTTSGLGINGTESSEHMASSGNILGTMPARHYSRVGRWTADWVLHRRKGRRTGSREAIGSIWNSILELTTVPKD
ncbi:hypothetical protein PCASD_10422 [Puccinia coronata f. sp. avenae]|uniref:Uncharacterized protein n=1 Tax=Puccinia coronata f. sp. avenae TaxID=200324 RepID=A0A2N5UEI8_9BASI|nr:hypothetical protein PCASD_10422 [Puccinia coronata f. sp. avenae]